MSNKNKLIEQCKGEYLILCDADDWMEKTCLEKIAKVIEKENPDRVIVEVAHIDMDNQIVQVENIPENQTKWGWNIHHGCANKVSILREHDIRIEGYPDDVYFTMEFSKYCKKVSVINEVLYYWLVHRDSAGRKNDACMTKEYVEKQYGEWLRYVGNVIGYVKNQEEQKQEVEEVRLVLLKIYYFILFFSLQAYSLKEKLQYYYLLRSIVKSIDKEYLHNKFLWQRGIFPLRKYAMRAIKMGVWLERCHIMPIALIGYHVLTKFKYFDQ